MEGPSGFEGKKGVRKYYPDTKYTPKTTWMLANGTRVYVIMLPKYLRCLNCTYRSSVVNCTKTREAVVGRLSTNCKVCSTQIVINKDPDADGGYVVEFGAVFEDP